MSDNGEYEYVDRHGDQWTWHINPRLPTGWDMTSPAHKGLGFSAHYVIKTYGPLTPAAVAAEVESLRTQLTEAQATNVELSYERKLLGLARRVLDEVAAGHEHHIPSADVRRRAEAMAQAIVDEIGQPVTDEPALGPLLREQLAEAQAELGAQADLLEAKTAALARATTLVDLGTVALAEAQRERDAAVNVLKTAREDPDWDPGGMVTLYDEAIDRAITAEADRDRMKPVVEAAEAWRLYSNGTIETNMPVAEMIQRYDVAIEALNAALDSYRQSTPKEQS